MTSRATPPPGSRGSAARILREGKLLRLLELALRRKTPIAARYRGDAVTLSPHVLGRRGEELYVLIFGVAAVGGGTVPLRWQWIRVAELEDVRLAEGFWLTAPGERPSADFLDRIIARADAPPEAPEDDLPSAGVDDMPAAPEDPLPAAGVEGMPALPDDDLPTL